MKTKKRSSTQKSQIPRIFVFFSKNVRVSTKFEVKTKKKNGHYLKNYANFHKFWGETTKTYGRRCKIYEKTVFVNNSGVITPFWES